MGKICRHCKRSYEVRSGRGLCRTCWNNKAIRDHYHQLAPFGGDTMPAKAGAKS